jgi:hypothetical protein
MSQLLLLVVGAAVLTLLAAVFWMALLVSINRRATTEHQSVAPWTDPSHCSHPRKYRDVIDIKYTPFIDVTLRCRACGRVWSKRQW